MVTTRRSWDPVPAPGVPDGTVLYDGVCVLCSGWFHFVVARDPAARFRFSAVQDPFGRALARHLQIDPETPETNAVIVDGIAWFKSDAALQLLRRLPGWRWTGAFRLLPVELRDFLYDRVARNRYRLWGRTDACMIPDASLARHVMPPDQPHAF